MSPPDNALVLCVDEKSQIQALQRTQPCLPMVPGHPERRTATYLRNGTTTLFAALDVATGKYVLAQKSDLRVPRREQRGPQAIRLVQNRRPNPRKYRPTL